jgi:anti-sigma regulatory factor (Ser/Thr protein kinase)
MTSEVVTNAMVHGAGEVTLGVACGGTTLRVEVGDDNAHHPSVRAGDDEAEGGRGMQIVGALADDWGVDATADGKTVWFEIPVQP